MPFPVPMRDSHLFAIKLLALAACAACGVAHAQDAPPVGRAYLIEPSASITETFTDNNGLTTDKRSDLITQASVGLRASANSARLRGFLDYSLSGLVYTNNTARNELRNALNAFATASLVENRVFVDIGGNISQQGVSAFGQQTPDSAVANPNRVEVSTFSLSPYVVGHLGSFADYEARLSYSATRSDSSVTSDSNTSAGRFRLGGKTALAVLGWSAQLTHTEIDYSLGRHTEDDLARGVLTWAVTPQFAVAAIGGTESNNYVSLDKQSHAVSGFSVNWKPSERTTLFAERENRFFGESHAVTLTHRTARTVWAYSDLRDIASLPGQAALGSVGTAFDLFFQQFASVEPDPVLRRQLVNSFLQVNGISPSAQRLTAFQTSAVTLQRTQNLSFALLGIRDTLSFTASQSNSRRLDVVATVGDDFSSTEVIRQRGLSVDLAHRLTPLSSVSLNATYQRTTGSLDAQATSLKSLSAQWSNRLGRRTDFSLGARHAVFDSSTSPYDESAVYASLRLQF